MNEIQIFNNPEFGEIRTLLKDGEPWFMGRDVASALGYKDPQTSVRDRVRDKDTEKFRTPTSSGTQEMVYINESGLYRLIFGSKLPSAEKFQDWVYDEVLPSIRKTGGYGTAQFPTTPAEQIKVIAQGYVDLEKRVDTMQTDFEDFKQDLPLFPVELEEITKTINAKVLDIVGGKQSEAYKDRSLTQAVYYDIYGQLHRYFKVRSYKAIPRRHYPKLQLVVDSYILPVTLQERIDDTNAQQSINI